ncbi:MAG TPA: hypothetical protein VMZ73_04880 [Acidimicrobiales bacterium]|nr:hypothetical protein [Acidimicrobiales bacterium]
MAEAEEGVDELYGLDPNDFVAARNDLVKRLKKEGDKARAAEVAKLKRPTPAAWAVNQLARRHRNEVEQLVRLGETLRDAQDRALAGDDPGDMRQAGRARRDAVARLAERADRLLVERGGATGAHAGDVTATLEAASLDAEAGAAVLAGRLGTELEPPSGFGLFDLTVAPAPARAKPKPQPAPADEPEAAQRDERARREAEEAVEEARRRWEERRAQAKEAVARVTGGRQAVQKAEKEIARLEDLLTEAQRRLRAAARDAELAEDAASRAEDSVDKATELLRAAERRLAEL